MRVIYEPRGRAKEYAELAFNSYLSCTNGCKYCFAPMILKKSRESFHASAIPRPKEILHKFALDCAEMRHKGDMRRVHLNFVSDPYPEVEVKELVTRYCLESARDNGIGVNILTKGKYDVVARDFDLMKEAGVHLGITLSLWFEKDAKEWEPSAETVQNRLRILDEAHRRGIYTWVSMEPVIDPSQALMVLKYCSDLGIVDLWKVGKLNYHEHAKEVSWPDFREKFMSLADSYRANYIVKRDLAEAK